MTECKNCVALALVVEKKDKVLDRYGNIDNWGKSDEGWINWEPDDKTLADVIRPAKEALALPASATAKQLIEEHDKKVRKVEREAVLWELLHDTDQELFEDGVSADLAEEGVTAIPEAYMSGREDVRQTIRERAKAAAQKGGE